MSRRLQIVLPDPVAARLRELADDAGEPLATLATQMIRTEVAAVSKHGKVTRVSRGAMSTDGSDRRARWLEPYGGDRTWREIMWGAIVAMHGRYPRHLQNLKDGWWSDDSQTETLCALAVWRAEIDDNGQDPREELAFQRQLGDYAETLRRQPGGVEGIWRPGAPPDAWAS